MPQLTLEDLEPGDVLAYYVDEDFLAFLGIELAQALVIGRRSTYVHVAVWEGSGELTAYTNTGVALGGKYPFKCAVLRPMTPEWELEKGLAWARGRIGKTTYGWLSYLWIYILRKVGARRVLEWPEDSFICSSFVAKFLERAGVHAFPLMFSSEIIPEDFTSAIGLVNLGDLDHVSI
jgi:hypothetical protein